MELINYVKERGAQRALANKLAITPVLISQWANRLRPIPPERCVEIERATDAQVTRKDLRPDDWQNIWPELASSIPEQAAIVAQDKLTGEPHDHA